MESIVKLITSAAVASAGVYILKNLTVNILSRTTLREIFCDHVIDGPTSLIFLEQRIIKSESPILFYALKNELRLHVSITNQTIVKDNGRDEVAYGRYGIITPVGYMYVKYSADSIIMRLFATPWSSNMILFKRYVSDVKEKRFDKIIYFTTNGQTWNPPTERQQRAIEPVAGGMSDFLKNVEQFKTLEEHYIKEGKVFRRGYYLWGVTGTGKSTSIEMVATKMMMPVFVLSLYPHMTDSALITLMSRLPPNCIIVVEEFEKLLAAIKAHSKPNLTIGALLTAFDGPLRLPHGSILVLTANDNISPEDRELFCRQGRIDQTYEYIEKI